jgi:hypothetical protein
VKWENLDFARDKRFIISGMFERGNLDDVLSFVSFYGKDGAGNILKSNKYLNREGLSFGPYPSWASPTRL